MDIFGNKRTTFGGTPLFPFQPRRNANDGSICPKFPFLVLANLLVNTNSCAITIYQWDCKFTPAWKMPFLLTKKISRISNRKFWPDGKHPRSIVSCCLCFVLCRAFCPLKSLANILECLKLWTTFSYLERMLVRRDSSRGR